MGPSSVELIEKGTQTASGKIKNKMDTVRGKKFVKNPADFFTIKYCNKEISISKPLLPMKIALFIWFAAASSVMPFFFVFFKSRGLTVQDLSIIFMISPILQFIATSALGVLTDKIGHPKLILVLNILCCSMLILIFLFLPNVGVSQYQVDAINSECTDTNSTHLSILRECDFEKNLTSVGLYFSECIQNSANNLTDSHLSENRTVQISPNYCYSLESISSENETCLISCSEAQNMCEENRFPMVLFYGILQLLFITGYVNTFRFFDVTVVALVDEHGSDYGKERFFGVLGAIIGPAISSLVIKLTVQKDTYASAFILFCLLSCVCSIVVAKVDVRSFGAGKNIQKKALKLLKRPDYMIFVLILLVQGSTWGFFINFKGWYLEDMGLEPYKIGLLDTINAMYGLPILLLSKDIIENFGVGWIFVVAFIARTVQCLGYAFMNATWMAFPLELTSMFGYHLFWVSAMSFSNSLAVPGIIATVNSLAGSIHFTIGRSTGSIVGGLIMSAYNGETAFQVLGGINFAFGITYALYLLKKKHHSVNK